MRSMDRLLQRWRAGKAVPFIRRGDRLLDIGCFDGTLLARVQDRIREGVGIDPLAQPSQQGRIRMMRGCIPGDHPFEAGRFDCITMLAVLEHIRAPEALARECFRLLAPEGRVVITVPRPAVDRILAPLRALRLVDGMSLEEHYGYDPETTPRVFEGAGFRLLKRRSFQLGLNLLFVFEKPASSSAEAAPFRRTCSLEASGSEL